MFFSELSVLEHITKPQRPNVFSEEFGLCFWPKTFQHHLLLIYPAIRNKKMGKEKEGKEKKERKKRERVCERKREKKTWGLWAVQESIKRSFLSGENVPAR